MWVWVRGIPDEAKTEEIISLISQSFDKFLAVDARSLAGYGPVRVRIMCPDPSVFPVTLPRFYFGKVGTDLVVELDTDLPRSPTPRSPDSSPEGGSGGDGAFFGEGAEDDDATDRDPCALHQLTSHQLRSHLSLWPRPQLGLPLMPQIRLRHLRLVPSSPHSPRSPGMLRRSCSLLTVPGGLARHPRSYLASLSPSTTPTLERGQMTWECRTSPQWVLVYRRLLSLSPRQT